ncbi:hypothetical protein J2T60_001870 [Natronospira proteinivora]|uniref:DUF58 domain-containing protein n=1 Tax=Natronospira proteinivora TaxID=1807133 RepID=A0ABT1GAD8_9GAMM|nr:hypothetical protein [Natronospira proteinivora]MCP1727870.1 hypothetical protein [Natronospira proteinivora]
MDEPSRTDETAEETIAALRSELRFREAEQSVVAEHFDALRQSRVFRVSHFLGNLYRVLTFQRPVPLPQSLLAPMNGRGGVDMHHPAPWRSDLSHAEGEDGRMPLIIWAMDTDPELIRASCEQVAELLSPASRLSPVLITNVSDFSYYSSRGWLVEYVPDLSVGESGQASDIREARTAKLLHLARMYRAAPVLPVHHQVPDREYLQGLIHWLEAGI